MSEITVWLREEDQPLPPGHPNPITIKVPVAWSKIEPAVGRPFRIDLDRHATSGREVYWAQITDKRSGRAFEATTLEAAMTKYIRWVDGL